MWRRQRCGESRDRNMRSGSGRDVEGCLGCREGIMYGLVSFSNGVGIHSVGKAGVMATEAVYEE
jgi:hypothetical protein